MNATVRPCTVAEFERAPNCDALLAEYTAESAIPEIGPTVRHADLAQYKAMEAAGLMHMLGAFRDDGEIVGFLTLLIAPLPHFGGRLVATTESVFVTAAERKGGPGLALLTEAEHLAHDKGAVGLLVSAPVGGRLAQILPRCGYRETSRVFFRGLE